MRAWPGDLVYFGGNDQENDAPGGSAMLTIFDTANSRLVKRDGQQPIGPETVWIDLSDPTP